MPGVCEGGVGWVVDGCRERCMMRADLRGQHATAYLALPSPTH